MRKLWLFLFLIVLFCQPVLSSNKENYYFRHINTENGLSQNTVLSILQDKRGFMWFGTKDGLNRYDGNSIKIFKQEENNAKSIGNNTIWSLLEVLDGTIWVGTDRGIFIYNPADESFRYLDAKISTGECITKDIQDLKMDTSGNIWIASKDVYRYSLQTGKLEQILSVTSDYNDKIRDVPRSWSINIDRDDQVWICIINGEIKKYNPANNDFKNYTNDSDGKSLISSLVSKTINVNNNFMLIGSFEDGLRIMDKRTEKITPYHLENNVGSNLYVRSMALFSDGNYWIGTQSGLYIHHPESNKTTHLYHNINDRYSLSDDAVYSLYEDKEKGIWVGTYFGGVNYYPRLYTYFEMHYPVNNQNSITGERISGICEDNDGNIWIGTEDAGLNKLNVKTNQFEFFPPGKGLNYSNVHDLVVDGDCLWIGTYSHGINVYNLKTNRWKYYLKGDQAGMINNNDIFAIFKDSSGRIWIGTSTGAFLYDRETDTFIAQEQLKQNFISDIIEDGLGQIWFSSYGKGVYCYNPRTKQYKNYDYNPDNPRSVCYHKIISLYLDGKKRLWVASESKGICMFDEKNQQFVQYGEKDGFSNGVIYKILEDNSGNLWLSSNMGLMQFNPETKKIHVFTQNNGLPGNQFNYKSGYKDKTGKMYFGTVNGMITFQPAEFILNETLPPVVITDFHLLNKENSSLQNQPDTHSVTLKYNQSSFSFDFASLSYVAPEMNRYAYKMEGMESRWNYLNSVQKITYSNLPAGKYVFKVKASNNDGFWNEEGDSFSITVLPPFWQTQWAYFIYVLLLLFTGFFILNYYNRKLKAKNRRKQILFENQKEKEIYHAKIDFFTNVAHEIRTPLTLIKGPLEYILQTDLEKEELHSNLQIMEKNTERLLALINQLLDFRKTESKGFSLSFVKININDLLGETYVRFRQLAEQKSLTFTVRFADNPVFADVDKEALTKTISNLFTNAVKYAESFIRVTLTESPEQFSIRVQNDGKRIPNELKDKIFEPFYQIKEENDKVKSGSGIGLALVKSLIELHAGNVYLDPTDTRFNTFVIELPKMQENVIDLDMNKLIAPVASSPVVENTKIKPADKLTLLVVEDNEEMLRFIVDKLEKQYHIRTAKNGMEAIEILDKQIVNLIISDIMMPLMNGLELCVKVKNNLEYSHIPVILLTAMNNIQSKITGLESGADAYIEKPFSLDYLQARISNLLNNRKKIREAFANSPFVHAESIAMNKSDENFLNKLTEIIYKNISNFDFNIDRLAKELGMSRSGLLRKIKGISEFTPNDFIRIIRLKRAAEILQGGEYKVNEVCYLVGFSSTSYFTKAFHKQFGILPKNFGKV